MRHLPAGWHAPNCNPSLPAAFKVDQAARLTKLEPDLAASSPPPTPTTPPFHNTNSTHTTAAMSIHQRAAACPSPRCPSLSAASLFRPCCRPRPLATTAVDEDRQDASTTTAAAQQPGALWCQGIAAGSFVQEVQLSFPRVTWQPAELVKVHKIC
jgi:hypothetical protein